MKFEPFNNNTINFFNNNYLEGFNLAPGTKYAALRQALFEYYQTYHSLNGNFYKYLEQTSKGIQLSKAQGHSYIVNYFSSVTFIQLFIEVYIKEILETINPILVTGQLKSNEEKKIIDIICANELHKFDPFLDDRTVPFNIILSRLLKLIKEKARLPTQFHIDDKYNIFAENAAMLNNLSLFRNSIIHKGDKIMSKYSFELLFVNFIIPFITALLRLNNRQRYLERNLSCKINVLDELCKLKLTVDYQNTSKFADLERTLCHINHLKELGRASFQNKLFMGEEMSQEKLDNLEESHNRQIRIIHEHIAKQFNNYNNIECPCCGTKAFIIEGRMTPIFDNKTRVDEIKCSLCSYHLNSEIGEPKDFKLMSHNLFVIIN